MRIADMTWMQVEQYLLEDGRKPGMGVS